MIYVDKDSLLCPRCASNMRPAIAVNGGFSRFWMRCSKEHCRTFVDTYIPLPHQAMYHSDPTRYKLLAGGYGSAKTSTDYKERQKTGMITPVGATVLVANTMPQLNSTMKKDLEEDLPLEFIKHYSKQSNEFTLANDHKFYYRSTDDPEKFKSINLSHFSFLEASSIPHSAYVQFKSRTRNMAATVQAKDKDGNLMWTKDYKGRTVPILAADWRGGTLETNPDAGWIRSEVLLRSGTVHFFGDSYEEYLYQRDIDKYQATYIIPTDQNPHLPPDFEKEQSVGKPEWWVKRYFRGSFDYSEGLVYPSARKSIIRGFAIPKTWKRLIAMDYGVSDNTHFVFLAIDPKEKIAYLYDELVMNNSSIKALADAYKIKLKDIPSGAYFTTPVMDGRSINKRRDGDLKTVGDLFLEEDIIFDPAQMSMDARIFQLNNLFENGKLKIFDNNIHIIKEITEHKFIEKDLDKPNRNTDKPQDVRNHGVNALEFAVMELPSDLAEWNFTLYNERGDAIRAKTDDLPSTPLFNPLGDNYDDYYNNNFDMPDSVGNSSFIDNSNYQDRKERTHNKRNIYSPFD